MNNFRPKKQLFAPKVWGPDGKEIVPHVGGIIPEGSFQKTGEDFVVLPKSMWILEEGETDDMGKRYAPSYRVATFILKNNEI
ncbi:MAG: hypothetical protein Q8Q89_00930 [bacterium]|nr:hypothetical protein [bacterium]